MLPGWVTGLAIVSLVLAGLCALVIVTNILIGHRQRMGVRNVVWPVSALYFGPVAVWTYWTMGRAGSTSPVARSGNHLEIVLQYVAIATMRGLTLKEGLAR